MTISIIALGFYDRRHKGASIEKTSVYYLGDLEINGKKTIEFRCSK